MSMSPRFKKKSAILVAAIAVSVVVMGALLYGMQERLQIANCDSEIKQQMESLPELIAEANDETEQNTKTFDAIYQSKAETVQFMKNNNVGFEATDAKMAEYASVFNVNNMLVVKKDGTIIAQAKATKADFTDSRFDALRQTFSSNKASEAVSLTADVDGWADRYYSCALDADTMVVIEHTPEQLDDLIDTSGSISAVLTDVTIGKNGYVMAVNADDKSIVYNPDSTLVDKDATQLGLSASDLVDGNFFHATFNGDAVYCGVSQIDDMYYVYTVPESDLLAARGITVGVILFVFLAVVVAVALYGIYVMRDDERTGTKEKYRAFGGYHYNRAIGKKAIVLSVVGFLVVCGIAFYMQTLFALSNQSVTNSQRAQEISETLDRNNTRAADLKKQYSTRYITKCHEAAYILEQNPSLATREKLAEMVNVLQIATIYVYNGDGEMTASSTSQRSYTLSNTYGDSSYEFRSLLAGKDEYVQDPATNASTGEVQQYLGVATYDENGIANGIVQISVRTTRLQTLLTSVKIDHVLDGVKVGSEGFAFALNKDDGNTVAYYPNSKMVGKTATELGLTDTQIKDGFSNYVTLNDKQYFANCLELSDYYLYVAGPEGELMAERAPLTVATGIIAAVCLAFVFVVLSLERAGGEGAPAGAGAAGAAGRGAGAGAGAAGTAGRRRKDAAAANVAGAATSAAAAGVDSAASASASTTSAATSASAVATSVSAAAAEDAPDARVVDVTLADGTTKKTESAVSRWLNRSMDWHEKTPEQKLSTTIRLFVGIAAFVVCFAVIFEDQIFAETSVFRYILGGGWDRGLNIFAVTASIMYACVALTFAAIAQWVLHLLSDVLGTRGETVCRLLSSMVKYGTVLVMLYWCLGVLGVDTATLLAGAGIITLAVSFGAKDLITDILCGLFIIFEGEFRVGDVIQVGSNTGTVMDIGVRTTKIKNGSGDVLVLRNSGISNVVNKTKLDSYANVDVILPTGESLTYLENVLAEELPKVRRRVPDIIDGPFYKGVVELTEETMTIRVVATCAEGDRGALERTLKREMKLLLTRHDIAPFVKAFDHDTEEKTAEELRAEAAELRAADRFTAEQEDAAEKVGNDAAGGAGPDVPPPPA